MLWEYMDLTVLPFFETWSAHIFGGWQRVCWCTNEAFNQASPTKEFWENCPQKKGGHIYGKNEGWAYLRKLLYFLEDNISKNAKIELILIFYLLGAKLALSLGSTLANFYSGSVSFCSQLITNVKDLLTTNVIPL